VTIDALMRAREMTGADLTRATGLSSAMVTRILSGERFGTAGVLERIRQAFKVKPAELFDPDAALAQIGLARRDIDTAERPRHTPVASSRGDHLGLPSPNALETGGPTVENDPELWAALGRYWDGLSTEQRLELVGKGNQLRKAAQAEQDSPPVGFRRG
jgi:transcriptional regulator with XRE-family HTH domain